MQRQNLLKPEWAALHPADVRIFLEERFGGPGQIDLERSGPNVIHLPLAREDCKVSLRLHGAEIKAIERGVALEDHEWQAAATGIDQTLLAGVERIGRSVAFSSYRVDGHWCGEHSRVQIMPAPASAPRPPVEAAEHPFVLEFPVLDGGNWLITNQRRQRISRRLVLLLNLLLAGRTSCEPVRVDHAWAWLPEANTSAWVQLSYCADIGSVLRDDNTPPDSYRLTVLSRDEYANIGGFDNQSLRIPADLDISICGYFGLKESDRERFDRALFWLDAARRQFPHSVSSTFASLVTAVEAMLTRGAVHHTWCEECGRTVQHDAPSINANFKDFFEIYAAGNARLPQRMKMYQLRSTISHGSGLMLMDGERSFGWHPIEWRERELLNDLWQLTQTAMRNWLQERIAAIPAAS